MNEERMTTAEYMSLSYEEKIEIMIETPSRLDLPEEASFLAQYLAQYRPILPPEMHLDNETSLDIAETMESICMIPSNVVSRAMKMLGYRLHFQGVSQPQWAMRHIESL